MMMMPDQNVQEERTRNNVIPGLLFGQLFLLHPDFLSSLILLVVLLGREGQACLVDPAPLANHAPPAEIRSNRNLAPKRVKSYIWVTKNRF